MERRGRTGRLTVPPRPPGGDMSRRRLLLLGVAVLLSGSALLAVAILLIGRFGETEQRILGTTMLLAAVGLLALPSVVLFEQGRARGLAWSAAAAAATAAALAVAAVWGAGDSDAFGKTVGTAAFLAVALAQAAALAARRRRDDPQLVRRLYIASCVLVAAAAATAVMLLWAAPHGPLYPRGLGALVVVDLLTVALQPVLARARPTVVEYRFAVALASGETVDVTVSGGDTATAAAKAIRAAERAGGSVVRLEVTTGS